ncbi:SPOR domain-containing protein [Vibrio sp. SS-MA-C1-2]|uniref:SPOR domain-containing protein n=1 Tax=Vibrio sp. SS-MA-C1-2 TaxID=2908646 RepID=UPI001F3F4658|nr:SPOR domain-containing protein [Vibrio sp. SS-MA-C1-2]UJF17720.1 SPOR domain-containing protein [Vibrio sp. SS-MA-C1-2]
MKKTSTTLTRFLSVIFLTPLLLVFTLPVSAHNNEQEQLIIAPLSSLSDHCQLLLTDSKSDVDTTWKIINSKCDIGEGLWSREPKNREHLFWLQCGFSATPPASQKQQKLATHFMNNVYLHQGEKGYRCLIGPFKNIDQAIDAKDRLIKQLHLKSFIREIPIVSAKREASITQPTLHYLFHIDEVRYYQVGIDQLNLMPLNWQQANKICRQYRFYLPSIGLLKKINSKSHLKQQNIVKDKRAFWSRKFAENNQFQVVNLSNNRISSVNGHQLHPVICSDQ